MLTAQLHSVDLFAHLKKRRTYPGICPLLHLDHIYYEGARVEVRKVELPRTGRALIASDHPLVADLRIRFQAPSLGGPSGPLTSPADSVLAPHGAKSPGDSRR